MKIAKKRLMEIVKEEIRSLVEEDGIDIQRVTDIDQMVKNFLSTASWTKVRGGDEEREKGFRKMIGDIAQYIINGEVHHLIISQGLFVDSKDEEVKDDRIWDKFYDEFKRLDRKGSSGMVYDAPEAEKDYWGDDDEEINPEWEEWERKNYGQTANEQKIKLTKSRLMEIVKEEVVKEVTSDKQRRFMCAMKDEEADERPDGLSKDEAEEMCTGPMKEEEK